MTKSKQNSKLAPKTQQLRGEALEKRIEAVIREQALATLKTGAEYIYNASRIARIVPTTRKSLAKHGVLVARVLEDLNARRRMSNGEATAEHLSEQIAYLRDKIAEKDKTIAALRSHHIEIYRRFHEHSIEAEILIRPILEKESDEAQECLLCKRKIESSENLKRPSNVLNINDR